MKKLVLLLIFIYLSNIGCAQIVLPSMRVFGLPAASPKSIFKGGAGYTSQSNFLLQSICTPVYVDNIFKGGAGYTSQSNSLLQSICTPVYIDNIFRGGEGYTSQSNFLVQSICTPVFIDNIFRGGEGYTSQSNFLVQSICTPVYIENIFRGGEGYSSQSNSLIQSNCTPVYIDNIFKGGSGYSSQNAYYLNSGCAVAAHSTVIGAQQWMTKNLNVTTYRNGDIIPQVTDPTAWAALTTGAWCYPNNNPVNEAIYGKLYNWYAVNDSRGLAPQGWHIPTDAELTTLGTNLGGDNVAGGKMKTLGTNSWASPNTDATNESGFAGLPGGGRYDVGTFSIVGNDGLWWSATESSSTYAWSRGLYYGDGYLYRYSSGKKYGFSVRCVKD
jgi:uncharacterized protein (TIGR02145 family)